MKIKTKGLLYGILWLCSAIGIVFFAFMPPNFFIPQAWASVFKR